MSRQIRYIAVRLHLYHARGYAKPEIWAQNRAICDEVKATGRNKAKNGTEKLETPD